MSIKDVEFHLNDLRANLAELKQGSNEPVSHDLLQRVVFNQVDALEEIVNILKRL